MRWLVCGYNIFSAWFLRQSIRTWNLCLAHNTGPTTAETATHYTKWNCTHWIRCAVELVTFKAAPFPISATHADQAATEPQETRFQRTWFLCGAIPWRCLAAGACTRSEFSLVWALYRTTSEKEWVAEREALTKDGRNTRKCVCVCGAATFRINCSWCLNSWKRKNLPFCRLLEINAETNKANDRNSSKVSLFPAWSIFLVLLEITFCCI